ncbi:MAG: SDR family oxidoreductase [Armatimonas sp.]
MKVLVFGATGGTGVQLIQQLLDRGHAASAFIHKNREALAPLAGRLTCFTGDVRDYAKVSAAVSGHDAVLVALGAPPGPGSEVLSAGTKNIVRAMQEHKVKRLVVETGAGLAENPLAVPWLWKLTASLPPMRRLFDAKRAQEKAVRESGLDWVLVRPVNLTNGALTGRYRTLVNLPLQTFATVSRADVAHFMLAQLTGEDWLHQAVTLS